MVPGVSKKHVRVKYNLLDWKSKSDTEKFRNIVQKAELNDMKWSELSGNEKWGVVSVPIVAGLVVGGMSLTTFMRWFLSRD